jgi:hypothetical protein
MTGAFAGQNIGEKFSQTLRWTWKCLCCHCKWDTIWW